MRITSFDFKPKKSLAGKYTIIQKLGEGYEGEVYLVKEEKTNIERAAKFFFPHRNKHQSESNHMAKKLHLLEDCPSVVQYHFQGTIQFKGKPITYVVSQLINGTLLSDYVESKPGKRVQPFEALHITHAIVESLLCIHNHNEAHGDIHEDNVMVRPKGIGFEIKLIDLFNSGSAHKSTSRKDDIVDVANMLYFMIGGKKHYAKMPDEIKYICCGLKKSLILKKFPNMQKLKVHLENFSHE